MRTAPRLACFDCAKIWLFLAFVPCVLLSGCFKNTAHVEFPPVAGPGKVAADKRIYVALDAASVQHIGEDSLFDGKVPAESIILSFSKFLAPVSAAVMPAQGAETREDSLVSATACAADYVLLIHVRNWFAKFLHSREAELELTFLSVPDSVEVHKTELRILCQNMSYRDEASMRECIRPYVNEWATQVFGVDATTKQWKSFRRRPDAGRYHKY